MEPDTALETVYPLQQLEDEIAEPKNSLPAYLNQFIADFKGEHLKYEVSPENVLSWMYYDYTMSCGNKFVGEICGILDEYQESDECIDLSEVW